MIDADLKAIMMDCLEKEKAAVQEELDDYRCAIAIIVTPDGRLLRHAQFFDEQEKIAAYLAIVQEAKAVSATAIVTVNAARTKKLAKDEEDGYWWGKLDAESARDCISISASGPNMQSYGLDLAYAISDGKVYFDKTAEFAKTEIGLLPRWPNANQTTVN